MWALGAVRPPDAFEKHAGGFLIEELRHRGGEAWAVAHVCRSIMLVEPPSLDPHERPHRDGRAHLHGTQQVRIVSSRQPPKGPLAQAECRQATVVGQSTEVWFFLYRSVEGRHLSMSSKRPSGWPRTAVPLIRSLLLAGDSPAPAPGTTPGMPAAEVNGQPIYHDV